LESKFTNRTTTAPAPLAAAVLAEVEGQDCRRPGCGAPLEEGRVRGYLHPWGWSIQGQKVWLWVECPRCGYGWSINKLGVPRTWVWPRPGTMRTERGRRALERAYENLARQSPEDDIELGRLLALESALRALDPEV